MDEKKKWYKVLKNGRSCHGGRLEWSLPTDGQPGEWQGVDGELSICNNGLHVTDAPAEWMALGCDVYHTECEGHGGTEGNKAVFRRVRLTQKLTSDELRELHIAGDGEMSVENAVAFAFGSVTVKAWDNSTVNAWGNSTVEACGNSTVDAWGNSIVNAWHNSIVKACGNSTVKAWGNSTVKAFNNSTVKALGNSTVEAWDNSTVEACGNSIVDAWHNSIVKACGNGTVDAWDNSTVEACDNSTVKAWGNSIVKAWGNSIVNAWDNSTVEAESSSTVNVFSIRCNVAASGEAVVIDRTKSPPVVRCGWQKVEAAP